MLVTNQRLLTRYEILRATKNALEWSSERWMCASHLAALQGYITDKQSIQESVVQELKVVLHLLWRSCMYDSKYVQVKHFISTLTFWPLHSTSQ